MSEADLVPWATLAPSRLQRALQRGAVALTLGAGLVLTAGAVRAPSTGRWLAVAVAAAAAAWGVQRLASPRADGDVCVPRSGPLLWRSDRWSEPVSAAPVFCSRWLIVLAAGPVAPQVWADQLDAEAFRRLSACARWRLNRAEPTRDLT